MTTEGVAHDETWNHGGGQNSVAPLPISRMQRYKRRLMQRPIDVVGLAVFLCFIALAAFGPQLAPYGLNEMVPKDRLEPPSIDHPFGTDQFGRDVMSRVMHGTRSVFLLSGLGSVAAMIVGVSLGMLSGLTGGLIDDLLMRGVDILLAIPPLILALVLLASVGASELNIVIVLVLLYGPIVARLSRSIVLDLKNQEFMEAACTRRESRSYVVLKEVLPCAIGPLAVEAAVRFALAIFMVASLGFLGLGVQPPSPDWGLQINEARQYYATAPWMLLFPAAAIALLVTSASLASDALRQVLEPARGG